MTVTFKASQNIGKPYMRQNKMWPTTFSTDSKYQIEFCVHVCTCIREN